MPGVIEGWLIEIGIFKRYVIFIGAKNVLICCAPGYKFVYYLA